MAPKYERGELLYEGKAKAVYKVKGHSDLVWMDFKDSLTAFNGEKKGSFEGKGEINAEFARLIFRALQEQSLSTHFVDFPEAGALIGRSVKIIPLEVVVRNTLAGSTAKRLGFTEGTALAEPLVEFYYKNDELGDPFLSDDQALLLKAVSSREQLSDLKERALRINQVLVRVFEKAGIQLVDYKLEFGWSPDNELLLADEITPDSCRLWDGATGEKMDKDRFRRDLGLVKEKYQEVLARLNEVMS